MENESKSNENIENHESWGGKLDFLVSIMGLSIGYGNIWRFPYLCYKHGGGAFLIPYFIAALICGIPLLYIESLVGQLKRKSALKAWKFTPLFEGIGLSCVLANFYLGTFYIILLSWTSYYLFVSFQSPLPWSKCDKKWATLKCRDNFTLTSESSDHVDPVNQYFENQVLRISPSIENLGPINWPLFGCMIFSYTICYFIIWKGIKVSGKIMYVTALVPFLFLIMLMIRSVTLKGSLNGIKYFLKPDLRKLGTIEIWAEAGTQIFFSYTIACGALTALGSHNEPDHNSYRDVFGYSIMNSLCSLISGFVIFPVLGFMAQRQNVNINVVAKDGPSLAFIAYPRALAELPGSTAWSILFFLSLIFLGVDSEFVTLEASVLALEDILKGRYKIKYRKEILTLIICFVSFLISLTMVTNGGIYVFIIFNSFPVSKVVVFIAFFEVISIGWVYGYKRLSNDMKMIGLKPPGKIFKYTILYLTPTYSLIIFILSSIDTGEVEYGGKKFPSWAIAIGWTLSATVILPMIAIPVYNLFKMKDVKFKQRLKMLIKCSSIIKGNNMSRIKLEKRSTQNS